LNALDDFPHKVQIMRCTPTTQMNVFQESATCYPLPHVTPQVTGNYYNHDAPR